MVEILIPQRALTAAHAVARSLPRTWPRRHVRIDVGELGLGQDSGRVRRHLGAGRPDRARERRDRQRVRSEPRSGGRTLRLAAVALIAADANEGLFASVGATTVRLKSDTTDVTLRPRNNHTRNHENTKTRNKTIDAEHAEPLDSATSVSGGLKGRVVSRFRGFVVSCFRGFMTS